MKKQKNTKHITISIDENLYTLLIKEAGRRSQEEGKNYNYADMMREATNEKYGIIDNIE